MGRGKPFKPYPKSPDVAAVIEINGEVHLKLSEVPRRIPVQPGLSVPLDDSGACIRAQASFIS